MVGRLLVAGHSIGRRMRRLRRRHRELVDIISVHPEGERRLRVLEHPAPTAYCLPGRESRVVVSKGVIDALTPREFEAVLTHEGAHLRGRHDLLVEFFSVIHETVPEPVRCQAAMGEVRLLVEALADRAAVRRVGKVATMKALIELEGSRAPEAAMAAGASTTATRLGLIREARPRPALTAVTYAYAVGLLALPIALFAAAWV
jgi:Zn-dependent protease with chaperone function